MIRTMPRTCLFKARAFQGRIDRLHFISGNRAGGLAIALAALAIARGLLRYFRCKLQLPTFVFCRAKKHFLRGGGY